MEEKPQEIADGVQSEPIKDEQQSQVEENLESVEAKVNEVQEVEDSLDDLPQTEGAEKSGSETGERISESDDASVVLEREEGDGQESTPNRKVDDDEDKRNPQYIPKRGTFYEHDDRTAADEGDEEDTTEKVEKENSKKKVWSENESSKWSHDRFNDHEQAPKSRDELVAIYGYDIRNEEGPPRARRRRRYGRGPNKYTRNWEDEEAYSKPTNVSAKITVRKPRRSGKGEEFPPLGKQENDESISSSNSKSFDNSDKDSNRDVDEQKREERNMEFVPPNENGNSSSVRKQQQRPHNRIQSRGRDESNKSSLSTVQGVTKTRGFYRGRGMDRTKNQKNQKLSQDDDYSDYILSQNFTNKSLNQQQPNVEKLEKDMANMNMQQQPEFSGATSKGGKFGGSGSSRQNSVPPRLQAEQRGSKRYSSLRQRSLPETAANPNFNQHPSYYHQSEYGQQSNGGQQSSSQGLLGHPHSQVQANSSSTQLLPTNGAPPLIQGPYAQPYPQAPPAFLPPNVAPPPFIPQQAPPPQIINYAQPPQPYPQPPPTFSNFQHQQFNPVNQGQPAELYQPQGGITYYSTQNQQVVPRVPQKRIKAAIPIVPPPEHKEPRGRGRLSQSDDSSPVGNTLDVLNDESIQLDSSTMTSNVPSYPETSVVLQQ